MHTWPECLGLVIYNELLLKVIDSTVLEIERICAAAPGARATVARNRAVLRVL